MSSNAFAARLRAPAPLDAAIDAALAERRIVGAVVLVSHRGRELFRRAAGWADRERGVAMRDDALFRLASVTKPIVAAATMVLAQRGVVDLDAPVTRWLPDFRPRLADGTAPDITLRHLLSHQAGLGYRFLDATADGPHAQAGVSDGMDDSGITLAENLRRIAQVPLQFAPGTGWFYSLGVDVAGGVLEAATGRSLGDVVRETVTDPLGMADTAFHALEPARLATPYVSDTPEPHALAEGETVPVYPDTAGIRYSPARALDAGAFPSGGAGMVGTADDLLRFFEALRQGGAPILDPAWVARMASHQTGDFGPPDAPGWGFALGFSVLRDPAPTGTPESPGTWRWGGAYGHSWFVDPTRELTVVALTNTLYEGMDGAFVNDLRDAAYAALEDRA